MRSLRSFKPFTRPVYPGRYPIESNVINHYHLRRTVWFIVAFASVGCSDGGFDTQVSIGHQRKTVLVQPSDAFIKLVDSTGKGITMPDGVTVVMENNTYETQVLPHLMPDDPSAPAKTVAIDATFALEKASIVVDVIQTSDGGAEDVSRTYWVVRPTQVFSAERSARSHAMD
ncbi:MAG: hypothetical protein CMM07_21765 [Rhodopirellula sp.]|nr:hypothetical protein [Rhodopirellula sp.]